jgi:hypothetical protein
MPDDINTRPCIEFLGNESRWEALFYIGFGGCVAYYFASFGGATAIIGCVAFGVLFLLLAGAKAFGELDHSVYLSFDEEGLLAPHPSETALGSY